MKLAMIVLGGLHASGREQVVPSLLALFTELARRHEVHAFALRHLHQPQSYMLNGFTVHDLGRPWSEALSLRRSMAGLGPFDIVHGFWADPSGALAVRMGRRFRIPSVTTFDSGEFESLPDIDYGSQRTWLGRRAVREALAATRVHVCTDFMARKAAARAVTPVVIPLTSITAGGVAVVPRVPARASLRLIQVSTLSRVKHQRLLVDVVATLASSMDVHLDLVGEDALDGQLQRQAAALGIANRITFHGFVPQDRLPEIFRNADFYVQTSRHEAAGVSVLEAAANGIPVIGTRVGYIADWSPDRAVALDSPDAVTLADAIVALHTDRPAAAAMAARARSWVVERDVNWVARQFDDLYHTTRAR